MSKKKERYYVVERTVLEKYQVVASSKKEALSKIEDPYSVTVVRQTITTAAIVTGKQIGRAHV